MVYTQTHAEIREKIAIELQPLLADLISLSLQGKQLHWNVVGPFFQPVHAQLDQIVDDTRGWADDVAERMVTVGAPAGGQTADVEKGSSLPPLPPGTVTDREAIDLMVERLTAVVGSAREVMDRLGEVDLVSQDLVLGVLGGLEKHLWMTYAQRV